MSNLDDPNDPYTRYAHYDQFDDETPNARRREKPKKAAARRSHQELAEIPGTIGNQQIATTYQPSRYEEGWLISSLGGFFEEQLITDILYHVKGGKEASVYCCRAHPSTGVDLLAAKVYRPRQFRSMRNDALYREGRALLTVQGRSMLGERGRQAQRPDRRMMRAVAGKSAFGQTVLHTSWLSYEFSFMEQLFRAGAAVPKPIACGENALLMGYIGDEQIAAPTLNNVTLEPPESNQLLADVIKSIKLMLAHGYIHGDLSAYNILYWEGQAVLIDFPQVTDIFNNPNAREIFGRDVTRICEYFARCGAPSDPFDLAETLWARYALAEQ